MILRQTLRPVAIGVTIGMALAAVASQILTSILWRQPVRSDRVHRSAPEPGGSRDRGDAPSGSSGSAGRPGDYSAIRVTQIGRVGIAISVPTFAAETGGRF